MAGDGGGMTIETKFQPGDTVFFMKDNKVRSQIVKRVNAYAYSTGEVEVAVGMDSDSSREELCFATKEELLASL